MKGRKRHILVDVCGLLLAVFVSSASVQDRDGAVPLIHAARESFPSIEKILVDGAYVGEVINDAASATGITVEVTKRNEQVKGFVPVAKRWSVERTLGWLGRYRRTSKDYERYSETEEYVIKWAMVALLLRRLAPGHPLETPRCRSVIKQPLRPNSHTGSPAPSRSRPPCRQRASDPTPVSFIRVRTRMGTLT